MFTGLQKPSQPQCHLPYLLFWAAPRWRTSELSGLQALLVLLRPQHILSKNYFVWHCLRKALISFVFSLCFICATFSPKERVLSCQFSCSSPELQYFICLFLMLFPGSGRLHNHIHSSVPSVSSPPAIPGGCHLLMTLKWKCHAVRLINANNII